MELSELLTSSAAVSARDLILLVLLVKLVLLVVGFLWVVRSGGKS